jgi:hypothetical protein
MERNIDIGDIHAVLTRIAEALENQTATQLDIHQFVKARDKHLIPTTTKVTILREPAYNDPIPAEEQVT